MKKKIGIVCVIMLITFSIVYVHSTKIREIIIVQNIKYLSKFNIEKIPNSYKQITQAKKYEVSNRDILISKIYKKDGYFFIYYSLKTENSCTSIIYAWPSLWAYGSTKIFMIDDTGVWRSNCRFRGLNKKSIPHFVSASPLGLGCEFAQKNSRNKDMGLNYIGSMGHIWEKVKDKQYYVNAKQQ